MILEGLNWMFIHPKRLLSVMGSEVMGALDLDYLNDNRQTEL